MRNTLRSAGISLSLLIFCLAHGQLPAPDEKPIFGARMAALSPDGTRLAFCYRGDIWIADATGGQAKPITRHVELDAYPMFSPDGKWLTFSSTRNGNWDIFLVPASGGSVRQITFHSQPEIAYGWSKEGSRLIYSATYDSDNPSLFTLDLRTLRFERILEDYLNMNYASFSPDGKLIAYLRYGFHWSRARYSGTGASQIWLYNLETKTRKQLTNTRRQHLWPNFTPDGKGILCVTTAEETPNSPKLNQKMPKLVDNPRRTPNLWIVDLNGKGRQLTQFVGGSVRFPSVASQTGDIVFEYEGSLYLLKAGAKDPVKLSLYATQDDSQSTRRRETLTSGVTEAEPSPDGKTFAFGIRGDIWTIPMTKPEGVAGRNAEFAVRLTDWVGDDSDFQWSEDGKKLYFTSDREFYQRLYEIEIETMKITPLWTKQSDITRLTLSPDKKFLGFWVSGSEGGLHTLNLETKEIKRVLPEPGSHWYGLGGGDFAWSPDMKWMAVQRRGKNRAWNIWILPADGSGEPINITKLNASHNQPAWSPDGKYLFFQSNRNGDGLYILPLTAETVRPEDTDFKFEKPKEQVEVKIEFDGIDRRIRRHITQNPQADLTISSDGKIYFISEGDLWQVSYDGKDTKRLTTGGGHAALRVAPDGKKLFFIKSGELHTMNLAANNRVDKITFKADWERDVRQERQAAFTQFWRAYERGFYDPQFHGRDWEAIRKRYEPWLEGVDTREEFAMVLQMMVSELEASHSEVSPAGGGGSSPNIPHLGFTFDYSHKGPGIKVADVPERAPGFYVQTRIRPGEYVLKINGQAVTTDQNLFQTIANKGDRDFEFLVNDKPSEEGARTVKYKPLTYGEWGSLHDRNRIDRLRRYVEEHSDGKIGYVYISSMGFGNQQQFEREFYEYAQGKQGMIIDVRFNGGGNIADTLADWLERKPHGYYVPRDREPEIAPAGALNIPMVVMMNERSMSNAEMFPYMMRQKGLAKLVGWETPGYVIWTWGLSLVDGTGARMPQQGAYRLDGRNLENDGEKPDVAVYLSPEDWLANRDPQLDKAIEILMR